MSGSKILNMTFDNVTVGIAVLDTENVLYINRGLAKVFGYDHVKEMPENFASLFLSEFKPIIEDKICSKSEEKFKTKAYTARGDIITVSITARATYFESKKLCVLTVEDISEDEKLRMEKRIIEQQTDQIISNFDGAVLRVSPDGFYTFAKGGLLSQFGVSAKDIVGFHYTDYLNKYPESIEGVRAALSGKRLEIEYERDRRFYVAKHTPYMEYDGQYSVVTLLSEITEQKEASERLRLILDNFGGTISKISSEGVYTFVGGSLLEEIGVTYEDIVGRHYMDYLRNLPDSIRGVTEALKGSRGTTEFTLNEKEYFVNYIPLPENDGKYSVVSLMTNVTESKKLNKKLEFLIEHMDGAMFRIDSDGRFSISEGGLLNLVDLKPGEVVGMNFRDYFSYNPDRIRAIERAFKGEKTILEFPYKDRVLLAIHIPFEENGEIHIAGITSDITELRQVTDKMDYLLNHFDGSIYKLDPDGRFSISEGTLVALFGKKSGELVGTHYTDFLDAFPGHIEGVAAAYEGIKNVQYFDIGDGHYMVSHIPMKERDGKISVGGLISDVTDIRNLQDELSLERNYLRITFESIEEGLVTLDPEGKLIFINDKARKVLACNNPFDCDFKQVLLSFMGSEDIIECDKEEYYINEAGKKYFLNYSFRKVQEDNNHKGYILVIRDLTEKKKKDEELLALSRFDYLTGIRNRRSIENAIHEYEKKGIFPLSIIIGDINGLKDVNDIYGHAEGDKLLLEFSEFFRESLDEIEVIGRWGGDEFLAILPYVDYGIAQIKVENMKRRLASLKHTSEANVSFGFAAKDFKAQSIMEVISKAETSMFGEKLFNESSIHHHLLDTMLNALYEKSDETNAHCQRLNNYCQKIALRMNLSHDQKRELHLVSLLHDIGKLGIPDRVLNSKEKLTDDDWNYIKKHPEIGFRLLNTSKEMAPIANYVLQHHEKFDGTGYPNGLEGYDIPLVVRIITLIDSFDAMVSKRVYKDKMSMTEAIDEIKRCKGSHFDPDIADLFISIIEEEKGL